MVNLFKENTPVNHNSYQENEIYYNLLKVYFSLLDFFYILTLE